MFVLIRIRTDKQIFVSFDGAGEGTLIFEVGIVSPVTLVLVDALNTVAGDGENLPGGGLLDYKRYQCELPAKE